MKELPQLGVSGIAAAIPTLNLWGLLALTILLAAIGALALRRMSP